MTVYAGEFTELEVVATIKRAGTDTPLTGDDVNSAVIEVKSLTDGSVALAETALTWDEDTLLWRCPWNTAGLEAGTYRTKVTFTGPGNYLSWEYNKVKIKANPVELDT